jgi:hypothetical protein
MFTMETIQSQAIQCLTTDQLIYYLYIAFQFIIIFNFYKLCKDIINYFFLITHILTF